MNELIAKAEELEQMGSNEEAVSAWREALKYRTTQYVPYRFGRLDGTFHYRLCSYWDRADTTSTIFSR